MPFDFWAGWVAVLTIASVLGLGWFIFSLYFGSGPEAEDSGMVWDGNLREGSHPAPMWWFWLILASLVFSVVYLMLYPGLGSFGGAMRWTQAGDLDDSMTAWESRFDAERSAIAAEPLDTLQANDQLMAVAERIYARNCAACHGMDARGQANLFPNLTDDEWQWGGQPADIEKTIRDGRAAVMVAWGHILGDEGVRNVADYVRQLPQLSKEPSSDHPGRAQYNQFCIACHGVDGSGQPLLGAPSLANDVYLYGGDAAAVEHSISAGRAGVMPPFGNRLDDMQIRLLVAWLTRNQGSE